MSNLPGIDPAIFTHYTTHVNGVQLHYVRGGQGPLILLWHGFLETWYSWRHIMPALAEHYTVIAPDMRGYGDSDKPDQGYDNHTLVADFRALVQDVGVPGKVVLVGHDMGAPPALAYAGQYPDEVAAVVYFEAPVLTAKNLERLHAFTPEGTKNGGLWWWAFAFATDMPEQLVVGKEREFLTWFYQGATHDQGASIDEAAVAEYVRTFSGAAGVRGAFGVYRDIFTSVEQTARYDSLLHKVSVPVLALGGDKALGPLVKQQVEGVARHVRGGVVLNCGHFIADEQPAYLLQQVTEFLA